MAPDLAVEVPSPDDSPAEVLEKVADWLKAAPSLVWVVDPRHITTRVYRADRTESIVGERDALDGEAILPGFSCALASLLPTS